MPRNSLINRIRGEFLETPGLRLTLAQAQWLCGVERALCQRVLGTLVETGFYQQTANHVTIMLNFDDEVRRRVAEK